MMRIITGRAKGVRLKTLEGEMTRPTSERVKEAVFSMLQNEMNDRSVLDLFSGSGQLGLEAVSRGAAHATMVDKSADAIKIIGENVTKTRLEPFCTVVRSDAVDFIRRGRGVRYDLVFLDPPYASGLYRPVLRSLLEFDMLKPSTLIVCESDFDALLEEDQPLKNSFRVIKQSRYGRTVITVLAPSFEEEIS